MAIVDPMWTTWEGLGLHRDCVFVTLTPEMTISGRKNETMHLGG